MAYIIAAKGARNLIFLSELGWTVVYVALAWVCVTAFGLNGAGIAFFASYVVHVLMIYLIVRRLSGFKYSAANMKVSLLFILVLLMVFCGFYGLPYRVAIAVGILVLTTTTIYSIRQILNLFSPTLLPQPILRVLEWFRLVEVAT